MSAEDDDEGCDCVAGLPPWMGTFADLMSLLMCFFVLLLSFAEMDAMKFKRLAGSMAQAFGVQNKLNVTDIPKGTSIIAQEFSPGKPEPTPINEIWQKTQNVTELSLEQSCAKEYEIEQGTEAQEAGVIIEIKQKLEELIEQTQNDAYQLADALHEQIEQGSIEIETKGRLIIVRIREKGAFVSGSANLSPKMQDVMLEVKAVLALKPGKIEVQGHTDNLPINTPQFKSNWALASARAVAVAHELMKGDEIDQRRFEVSGFADTMPLGGNSTPEERATNRRVEILIKQDVTSDDLSQDDVALLKEDEKGKDILRELNLEPEYIFELDPREIF